MELFIAAALQSAASLRAEREAIQELQVALDCLVGFASSQRRPSLNMIRNQEMLYLPKRLAGWRKFTTASLATGALSCVMVFT